VPIFTAAEREEAAERLVGLLRADEYIADVALLGSLATGRADALSDLDIASRVEPGTSVEAIADRWTERMYELFAVVHHYAVAFGADRVRGFLLANLLEIDLGFGPQLGTYDVPAPELQVEHHAGIGWHDVVHGATALARGRHWRANHYVERVRERTLTMAAERRSLPTNEFKGIDDVPPDELVMVGRTFGRSLGDAEVREALEAATHAFLDELHRSDPALADRLEAPLLEFLHVAKAQRG
jgi:predicted nucleotidyltransferase